MQIKKFVGNTLKEAVEKMKEELGSDAVILSTKVIEPNAATGKKKYFEVTCGIDDDIVEKKSTAAPKKEKEVEVKTFESELKKITEKVYGVSNKSEPKSTKQKEIVKEDALNNAIDLKALTESLLQKDIEKKVVSIIIDQLKKYQAFLTEDNLEHYVVSVISGMINTSKFEINKNKKPKIISLIGPTGVGKTTCIAKLAVISKILHKLDVGLISIDTYRLGALDQLRIFSEVSNIDLLVAYEPNEMPKLVSKFKKKDLIFIDTVGRSQKNTILLKGIKDFLDAVKTDETYLVLNSAASTKNLNDVASKFKGIGFDGLIFTKLDEAVTYGNILNVVNAFGVPIKYLTNGQVIPDDIIAADPDFIANMIYTGRIN